MDIIEWIGRWPGAVFLQDSGTAYLLVNAAHILGIGLLVGAILPLDLRLMGFFRSIPIPILGPFLSRAAAVGVVFAVVTGLWLFSVKPREYITNPAFLWKLGLLILAICNIGLQHTSHQFKAALSGADISPRVRMHAGASALLWIGTLVAGRWIGFI